MFLVDTNVFLEILLILFRYGKEDIFQKFLEDVIPNIKILSLPIKLYREIVNNKKRH
jgi:hypothetical protein